MKTSIEGSHVMQTEERPEELDPHGSDNPIEPQPGSGPGEYTGDTESEPVLPEDESGLELEGNEDEDDLFDDEEEDDEEYEDLEEEEEGD